jgi:hypothetical protein
MQAQSKDISIRPESRYDFTIHLIYECGNEGRTQAHNFINFSKKVKIQKERGHVDEQPD